MPALRDAGLGGARHLPAGTKRDTEPYAVIDGVRIHRYPLRAATGGPLGYLREYGSALWHTCRLARRVGPFDVVHVCNPPDLLFLLALRLKRRGARFVFDQHDLVPELYLSRFDRGKDLLYRAVCRAGAARPTGPRTSSSRRTRATGRSRSSRGGKRPDGGVRGAQRARHRPVPPGRRRSRTLKRGKPHLLATSASWARRTASTTP